jgi:alcohol dehydrogenase class IV
MTPFGITAPGRILFGRGEATKAADLILGYGRRGVVVHGASAGRAAFLLNGLGERGATVLTLSCPGEPDLAALEQALQESKGFQADWVVAIGGGAVLDMGKALAGLIPQVTAPMDHLEGVGRGLRLQNAPLPFVAMPTTSGTGAEATKNAVIGVPDQGRKVSLRDDRMLARLAIVDPALTDNCPRGITLASGLDAITQVIEPYVSSRANAFTDAICRPAIGTGLTALMRLMRGEDAAARDQLAWVSLSGGLALANGGLGAVHGLAGVIGGQFGAAHGAICGALLGPVLAMNARLARNSPETAARLEFVCGTLGEILGCAPGDAPGALQDWSRWAGLPDLTAMGVTEQDHLRLATMSLDASSMKGNPVVPGVDDLIAVLQAA